MKKKLTAVVRMNGATTIIERTDYSTKTAFASDLRGNGYSVVGILTEEQVENARRIHSLDLNHLMACCQQKGRTIDCIQQTYGKNDVRSNNSIL